MDTLTFTIFTIWLPLVLSQYDHGRGDIQHGNQPPASILLHKQALGQDGSFNYAFAADNGLQQGEVINPDGSRKGSYSYVDPNGKTVSLSYTAGKDGFRVLNGDHVPKAPEPQRQSPQYDQYRRPPANQHFFPHQAGNPVPYEYYRNAAGAPAYRGPAPHVEPHRGFAPPGPHAAQHSLPPGPHPAQHSLPPAYVPHAPHDAAPRYQPRHYSVQEGAYDKNAQYTAPQYRPDPRQQEPRKPHSFGNGFAFEFGGK